MEKIWKYTLEKLCNEIKMPIGAEILSVQVQNNEICLWVKVKPNNLVEEREFRVYGTGWEIHGDSQLGYKNTVQSADGFVWHIFEVLKGGEHV